MVVNTPLDSVVSFVGHVHPSEVERYWEETDLFLMLRPSERATELTVPLKAYEALSYGVATLITPVGGLIEAFGDSKGAMMTRDTSVEAIRASIVTLLNEPAQIERMKAAARKTPIPTWNQAASNMSNVYQQVFYGN